MDFSFREMRNLKLARKIKPVVKVKTSIFSIGQFFYIEPYDINLAGFDESKPILKATELVKLCTIETVHDVIGYKCAFKPKISDVLSKIPSEIAGEVVAFSVEPGRFDDYDFENDYVLGNTTLYGLKENQTLPKQISEQKVVMDKKEYSNKEIDEIEF